MDENIKLQELRNKYGKLIVTEYGIPPAWQGRGPIRAIVLGADPTHIIEEGRLPVKMDSVFNITVPKSPYWRGISRNLEQLGLNEDAVYVQNTCRNYFTKETSKNAVWMEIAREHWLPFLREELHQKFSRNIPVLMTTEFILKAALNVGLKAPRARDMYEGCMTIQAEDNLLGRELLGFYRHYSYALDKPANRRYKEYLIKSFLT